MSLDVHRIWLKSQQHSGVSWVLVSTNLDSRLKKYSCRTNSTFQRMRVSRHWFRPLGQQIQNLYEPRFRPLGQQETKTLQAYWNYLAWFNLLLGPWSRIVFFLLGNIHCGKKNQGDFSEYLKSQLGLQMNFKRKKCSKLKIRKKIEKNLLYLLG